MSSRTRWLIFAVTTPIVLFVAIGGMLGATTTRTPDQASMAPLRVFNDVVERINGTYVEPVEPDRFMDGAMRGLVEGLDPSSAFLSQEETQAVSSKAALPACRWRRWARRRFLPTEASATCSSRTHCGPLEYVACGCALWPSGSHFGSVQTLPTEWSC